MRRRNLLAGTGMAALAASSLPAPAIAQGVQKLTMVTDWPEGPGVLPSARRLAQTVADACLEDPRVRTVEGFFLGAAADGRNLPHLAIR